MSRKKKLNKKKLVICMFVVISIFFVSVLARYILNQNEDFYSRTKEFYFNSDKLAENCPLYRIENWAGVDDYPIIINVNSNQNNILSAPYEIDYTIEFTCSDTVQGKLSKENGKGKIPVTTESDTFSLTLKPFAQFSIGDVVNAKIIVKTTSPYEKEISADFQLVIGQEKITYEIVDSVRSPYLELNITNTLSYYTVSEAFGSYVLGAKINRDTYFNLSNEDKQKCYSGIITLQFDPEIILLDMTNENYINATHEDRALIDGYDYIKEITFNVDAITGTRVRFYKKDIEQNYTYPNSSGTSIIQVIGI